VTSAAILWHILSAFTFDLPSTLRKPAVIELQVTILFATISSNFGFVLLRLIIVAYVLQGSHRCVPDGPLCQYGTNTTFTAQMGSCTAHTSAFGPGVYAMIGLNCGTSLVGEHGVMM
jgi:hypothetical protein